MLDLESGGHARLLLDLVLAVNSEDRPLFDFSGLIPRE